MVLISEARKKSRKHIYAKPLTEAQIAENEYFDNLIKMYEREAELAAINNMEVLE